MMCPNCGTATGCTGTSTCWCNQLPAVLPVDSSRSCWCKNCLAQEIKEYLEAHPRKAKQYWKKPAKVVPVVPCLEGEDYHVDERGRWVFTPYFHLRKGYCCQSSCRHCPYGYPKKKKTIV